jgi:hypothetical protein
MTRPQSIAFLRAVLAIAGAFLPCTMPRPFRWRLPSLHLQRGALLRMLTNANCDSTL